MTIDTGLTGDRSARLGLPLLQPGQAQKEMVHNEALTLLDILLNASVVAAGVTVPPVDPALGACWIVGAAPGGDWTGQAQAIAGWTAGGWRFAVPRTGMTAWCEDRAMLLRFDGTAWAGADIAGVRVVIGGVPVVQARGAAIADVVGGSVVDDAARVTIGAILAALRNHGLIAA